MMFWSDYPFLYDDHHIIVIARFIMYLGPSRFHMILPFLQSETSKTLFKTSPKLVRNEFVEMFLG